MIRNFNYIFLISLMTTVAGIVCAQDPNHWADDWRTYQSLHLQEKLFVHPAKTFCLAGELLWFKIYDLDASTNMPLTFSTIAYVELLDKDQHPVQQALIALKDGRGAGSFRLPPTLPSGNYLLRCYTSWMKNFNPDLFFHQTITIVNTFRNVSPVPISASPYSVGFFPEGGNLVFGLRSRLAFQLSGNIPDPQHAKGYVLDQKKDTIATMAPDRMGRGSFSFTPISGSIYKAYIVAGDSIFTAQLPVPYDKGFVMQLTEMTDGRLRISVQTNRGPSMGTVYLLSHTGGRLYDIQSAVFSNNAASGTGTAVAAEASFYIEKKKLGEGITHFTIFDNEKAPVCERLYFTPPSSAMAIDVQLSNTTSGTRKKEEVELTTTFSGQPAKANLSLSVFLLDSLQDIPKEDIKSYLLLSSELKGSIGDPRYYLEDSSAGARIALDNLLLTQGWSRFRWEEVLQHKKHYFEFLPETNGPLISGKLVDKRTGQPGPPTIGYLSVPGKSFIFSSAQSRPDGAIIFDTRNFYNNRDIIVQTNSQTPDSNYRIDITSPFSDKRTFSSMPELQISPALEGQLLSRSIAMQADNNYLFKDKHRFGPIPAEDTVAFYGKGDQDYYLDNYTRFQTLEEVMREFVDDVRVRQQSGMFHYRVRNNLFNQFFEDDPLVLIDGVPSFDLNKILATDPLKIQQIQIVARKFYAGALINDGIVSYKTYEGDLGGYQLDPNAVAIHYEGIQLQQEFYTPVYDKGVPPSSRIPDFRNLLQWAPDINTGADGKVTTSFFTSDIPGTYLLFVQGITDKGQPGSKLMIFTVHP
jgi:hypothetical protein